MQNSKSNYSHSSQHKHLECSDKYRDQDFRTLYTRDETGLQNILHPRRLRQFPMWEAQSVLPSELQSELSSAPVFHLHLPPRTTRTRIYPRNIPKRFP